MAMNAMTKLSTMMALVYHGPGQKAFEAHAKVKADIELQPLSSINTVFERLEHGDVPSRVVLDFTDTKYQPAAGQTEAAVRPVPVVA
jgi:hypothetical protein